MKPFFRVLPVIAVVLGIAACNETVELNASYVSDTVIFGILDPVQDTQWVRINRTWLGDGNNLDVATIRDSSEYEEGAFTGVVNEWKNGNLQEAYTLESMERTDKDENGIFFGPAYTAYFFVPDENGLDAQSIYEIQLEFPDSRVVRAETNIIEESPGSITQPPAGIFYDMPFATVTPSNTFYPDFNAKWVPADNASRYEISYLIHFKEITYTDETWTTIAEEENKTLEWFVGVETDIPSSGTIEREVNGEQFFRFLEANLDNDPLVRRQMGFWDEDVQEVKAVDFVLTIANDELNTYIEVNSPVTGVIQERPLYSNVSGGLGIFASRRQSKVTDLGLSSGSWDALVEGEFTADLYWCSPNPFSDYYCGD